MSLSLTLFFIFSIFHTAFCENCSEVLLENFQKTFNLSDKCGNCTVLRPESYSDNGNWSGICSQNRYLMFPKHKCENSCESIVLISKNTCKVFNKKNFDIDDGCFVKFIDKRCANPTQAKPKNNSKLFKRSLKRTKARNWRDKKEDLERTPNVFSGIRNSFVQSKRFVENGFRQRPSIEEIKPTIPTLKDEVRTKRTSTESISTKGTKSTEETQSTKQTKSTEETQSTKQTKSTEETQSTKQTKSTEEKEDTEETESTEPTETEETESTEPTETEETESTEPTETEETESTEPTETEETESTEPTETEETESTEITETEETESTEPTVTKETESILTKKTEQTVTQETRTPSTLTFTSHHSTSQTVTKTTNKSNSTTDPWSTQPLPKEFCEYNEYSFGNHCYFLKAFDMLKDDGLPVNANTMKNSTWICSAQHPVALGLAVETKDENKFVKKVLQEASFLTNSIVLTSGIRTEHSGGVWLGWNQRINHSILNMGEADYTNSKYYVIDPSKGYWQMWDGSIGNRKLNIMCERPYNPKNVVEEFYKQCLELYRQSPCYDIDKHAKYCCARDENGETWFACPGVKLLKVHQEEVLCFWECQTDGYFSPFRPVCVGHTSCRASHDNIDYVAPIMTYAISSCPNNFKGNSSWYCHHNRTFIGLPDYSLCCENAAICKDTDIFLNLWTGCPCQKIIKKTACPPGSDLNEAFVEWYCHSDGSFNGTTPDYSNCNRSDRRGCSKKDRYGVHWTAGLGTTVYKDCPLSFTGQCWWKCKDSGKFDGDEPDCTWCRAKWMDDVAEKIKGNSHHEEVIAVMEEYTEKEDLRVGYGHVLHLTSECVLLYKKQNIDERGACYHKFIKGYSKILKNLAGNPTLWSSFSVSSRKVYAEDVIGITKDATFAILESGNLPSQSYNATFTDLKTDGFDFFVVYNSSIKGFKFPLQNQPESDWRLEIKEVNESNSNFAAMGLVTNYSLSSLMFPQGEETGEKEINAPALTFAVAFSVNGKTVVDHNMTVSVSFVHVNKTRFPEVVEIKRRLHAGEKPSGVFNSTTCYYYSDSGWSSDGCTVTYTSKERTECTCTHLSTIGLLMTIHKYVPDKTLELISITSSGITILSLILALLVFHFFDTVNNDRVLIGKNLCSCLLLGHTMLITVMDKRFFYIPDEFCKIYAVILHYTFMAAFAWMFVEGCHLYRMLVLVFDSDIEYRYVYLLIGYGVPLVVVGVTHLLGFAFQEHPYGQDELCWLKYPNYIWAFTGPVIVITSVNFYILIIAMKLAISSRRRTEHSNLTSFKLWLKGWFTLSSLLGITWLFGLALFSYNNILLYCFVIFNGLQGFFIFLFRCLLNEQYKDAFLRRIKSLSSTFNSKYKIEDVAKSETKVVTINGSKSVFTSEIKTKADSSDSEVMGHFLDGKKNSESSAGNPEIGLHVEVTLKPGMSEAYLRNRMIAQNFAVRKSKATWMNESEKARFKF